MKRDIVYILKNDIQPDELRYSLRSVCENFPCRNPCRYEFGASTYKHEIYSEEGDERYSIEPLDERR